MNISTYCLNVFSLLFTLIETTLICFIKETEKDLAIEDENKAQEISKNDKSVHSDPSEKSTTTLSPGNVISNYH